MKAATTYQQLLKINRRKVSLVAVIFLLILPSRSPGASPLDDLYQLFQVDLSSADIVILLDASRSMLDHQYSQVRQAVVDFAPALTDKETLHLRVFGDVVSSPLESKGREKAGEITGNLPPEPLFSHTDLGLAIDKGLEFLERADASRVQAFFLLTDGLHQPPGDSPYSRDFTTDPDWQALQQRAQALCLKRQVYVYGFGLGQQTDIAVLRRVFPARNVEVIVGNAAQVAYALRRVRERLSRTQLRQAIEQELNEGRVETRLAETTVAGAVTSFDVPLTIRNAYRHLPVRLEQVKVQRDANGSQEILCTVEGAPANVVLEAGKQWQGQVKGTLQAELPRWHMGKTEQGYQVSFQFVPVVHFQHQAALEELGIDLMAPSVGSPALSVDLRASYGLPWWPFVVLGIVIAAFIGSAVVRQKRIKQHLEAVKLRHEERKCLAGKLKIWPARQDEPDGDGLDLSHFSREKLNLTITADDGLDVVTPESQSGEVVARLSGHLIGASFDDAESGKPEFHIEAAGGHKLAYESGDEMREVMTLTLCANDMLEIDGRWRLRYVNHRLRTRAEVESSRR